MDADKKSADGADFFLERSRLKKFSGRWTQTKKSADEADLFFV